MAATSLFHQSLAGILLVVLLCLLPMAQGQLTAQEKQDLLNLHNSYRAGVSPTAANMRAMVWDDTVAASAQSWADTCPSAHSTSPNGENMAWGWPSRTVASTMSGWYNEVSSYTYSTNACSGVCGHYTQVVWANSYKLGCGKKNCASFSKWPSSGKGDVYVCQYSPPGNYGGQRPYVSGTPCSQCPAGTSCLDNLCVAGLPTTTAAPTAAPTTTTKATTTTTTTTTAVPTTTTTTSVPTTTTTTTTTPVPTTTTTTQAPTTTTATAPPPATTTTAAPPPATTTTAAPPPATTTATPPPATTTTAAPPNPTATAPPPTSNPTKPPTPRPTGDTQASDGANAGGIAGAVVGALLIALAIGVGIGFYVYHKRKQGKLRSTSQMDMIPTSSNLSLSNVEAAPPAYTAPEPQPKPKFQKSLPPTPTPSNAAALPPGWTEEWDTSSNAKYYYHAATGTSQWERPRDNRY